MTLQIFRLTEIRSHPELAGLGLSRREKLNKNDFMGGFVLILV